MRIWTLVAGFGALRCLTCAGAEPPKANDLAAPEAVIASIQRLAGGTWRTSGGFIVELTFRKTMGGKGMRGDGVIGKGTPRAMETASMFGIDPVSKTAYYIDFHGHDTVYKGTVESTPDGGFLYKFRGIVSDPVEYELTTKLTDPDTMVNTILSKQKDGSWASIELFTLKRDKAG